MDLIKEALLGASRGNRGRKTLSEDQVVGHRCELTIKRQDLYRFRQASGHMALYCYETVSRSIGILYAWQRRWYPGTKKVLGDLAAWHPEVSSLVTSALVPGEEQAVNTIAVVDHVLRMIGGAYGIRFVAPHASGRIWL